MVDDVFLPNPEIAVKNILNELIFNLARSQKSLPLDVNDIFKTYALGTNVLDLINVNKSDTFSRVKHESLYLDLKRDISLLENYLNSENNNNA